MTASIQSELAQNIATALTVLGFTLFKGIVYQAAPDYDVACGELLAGTAKFPFVSLSCVQAEKFTFEESTNVSSSVSRTISVALIADKAVVGRSPGIDPYAKYRQDAMRILHTNRFGGLLTADSGASILHATVRPNSPIQQGPWQNYAKFVSSFDVIVQTDEPNTIP